MFEKGKIYLRINLSITVNEYKLFYRNKDGNIWIEWTIYTFTNFNCLFSSVAWKSVEIWIWGIEDVWRKRYNEFDKIQHNSTGKYENLNRDKNKDIDAIKKINLE